MSYGMGSPTAGAEKVAQQARMEASLRSVAPGGEIAKLMQRKANQQCADCTARNPQWASWNLGVFICERCCGVHRQLGTHISMPRSCTIDEWNTEQLAAMKAVGNLNAQCYWEYNVPFGEDKPEATDPVMFVSQWIRRKYETMDFLKRPGGPENNKPIDPGVRQYETSGWLLKEGGGTGGGKWQRRFFILSNYKLEYYDKQPEPGEKSVPKGIIPINPSTNISISSHAVYGGQQDVITDGVAFEVTAMDRTFYIAGETTQEICRWVRCMRGVRAYSAKDEVQAAMKTKMQGYMVKKGQGGMKGDKIRWIVLKGNGEMIYYKDNKSKHPQNRFYLEARSVSIDRSSDPPPGSPRTSKNYFQIRFDIRKSGRTWYLGVDTEQARQDWMRALAPWCA
eukprot:COSAG02_NODE_6238_length_3706_cov_6.557527_3_plen_394_part_00